MSCLFCRVAVEPVHLIWLIRNAMLLIFIFISNVLFVQRLLGIDEENEGMKMKKKEIYFFRSLNYVYTLHMVLYFVYIKIKSQNAYKQTYII